MTLQRSLYKSILLLPILLSTFGCATGVGILYTDTKQGLHATSSMMGSRVGEACFSSALGLFSLGDASIETARRNGGVSEISSVDVSTTRVLGILYHRYCTIVRGR